MTQEFENLLELLQSPDKANVNLGLILLENYKEEFEAYFKMSLEKDKELFELLKRDRNWQYKTPFDKIEALHLVNNKLAILPQEIVQLKNLKILEFVNNQLTILPKEIGQLKNLISLSLGANQLTTLPQEIGQLKNLKILYLNNNKLTILEFL